jgi:general secretion pathway protein F
MRYQVKAVREPEGVVTLLFEGANAHAATQQARSQGYTVLTVRAKSLAWPGPRRRSFPLVVFSQELLALLEAGLTVVDSIETLAAKQTDSEVRAALQGILEELREGRPFSSALGQAPTSFPALYVATVRAAERSGGLAEALSRYVTYQSRLDAVRNKIVTASVYPLLLIGVGGLVTLFLLGYVVPKFSRIYQDLGEDLPFMSRLLLNWGQLVENNAEATLIGFALIVAGIIYVVTQPQARRWLSTRLWSVPAIGERMKVYQLARFYRTLGMLLRGGTAIVPALAMVSGLLLPQLRRQLDGASRAIGEGFSISQAMDTNGLTTPVALRMLRVGERTGQMGEMMERIARFHDDEMALWVERFTRLFEPLLMALIGIVIGVIVVLMYLPIFELAGTIQ